MTGIGEGGSVAVGKSGATGVGVADWQAARMIHPKRRIFFMALFITQLSSTKCWTIREELAR